MPRQPETLTYEPFFGLTEKPFSLNADSRFVYESETYAATRESLLTDICRREGLLVLTGQIGTGKTTLCRAVLAGLGRNTYSSMVPDPFASREDLLKMLLIDFGVVSIQDLTTGPLRQASRTELGFLLSEFLNSLGADTFVVVVIDEAQNLALPLIEETRILSDTFAQGRLQIIFVGQPELHARLKSPEMRQVDQRVCGYHRLAPMSRDAVAGYIQHRLQVAGNRRGRVLFAPEILDSLHSRSGGVPRLINRVCDRALRLACDRGAEHVDREILDTALLEVGSATLSPTWDSIIHAEPAAPKAAVALQTPSVDVPAPAATPVPAAAAAPAPVVAPASACDLAQLLEADQTFNNQINQWVEQELAPLSRPPQRRTADRVDDARVRPRRQTPPPARSAPPRDAMAHTFESEWPRDLRSETYMQRLLRLWVQRAAIAITAFVAINVIMVAVSLVPAMTGPGPLPAAPEAPARALPALVLPAVAATEMPGLADAITAAGSVEYFVTVGLFTSSERADQLVDELTREGLPAMQRPVQLRGRLVQQIVLGPFFSRPDAVADLVRLQLLGGYADARVIDTSRDPLVQ